MFSFAIITIVFGYSIFLLGILHSIYPVSLVVLSIGYLVGIVWVIKNLPLRFTWKKYRVIDYAILTLVCLLTIVAFIGALGPETSFDALWYHLVFPKLYLSEHTIRYISGALSYSVMPKFGELLFTPALFLGGEILAKCVQFLFGIVTLFGIYKLARLYVSSTLALLACLIFYSNIVVSWESTVAYIDLIRTFFELLAVYAFIIWYEKKDLRYFFFSSVCIGAAIATKVLAFGSLFLLLFLVLLVQRKNKKSGREVVLGIGLYTSVALLVASPWLLLAFFTTGNPVYPLFTPLLAANSRDNFHSIQQVFRDILQLFLFADDPISPVYLISLPLIFMYYKKISSSAKLLILYTVGSLLLWFITPRTGGGRFILPYVPVWSVLVVIVLDMVKKQQLVYRTMLLAIFFIALTTIGYRGTANSRYLPVILGKESKDSYLSTHLNFSFGDFYDTDGYFKTHIRSADRVLIIGFHNLYYVDFPFVDISYIQKGEKFNYIATQHTYLPKRFFAWKRIYENKKTGVTLYNNEGRIWEY